MRIFITLDKMRNANSLSFWLILFINQRALYNHELSVIHHRPVSHPPDTGLDIETSYLVHMCVQICVPDMDIKYLVILTCSL